MFLHLIDRKTALAAGLKYFFDGKPCSKGMISERLASNGRCFCEKHRDVIRKSATAWHAKKAEKELANFTQEPNEALHVQIVDHETALSMGMAYFFTGLPCRRGGIGLRLVSNRQCTCPHCLAAHASYRKKSYHRNRDNNLLQLRDYYASNRERENNRSKKWKDKNRERISAYQKSMSSIRSANESMRRARKHHATPSWFGEFDDLVLLEAYDLCAVRKSETGIEWHVDHMFPLQGRRVCGLHIGNNLQVIPAAMNISKSNKMDLTEPGEWLRS